MRFTLVGSRFDGHRPRSQLAALCGVAGLVLAACGGGASLTPPPPHDAFAAVDVAARAAYESQSLPGLGVAIYNELGVKVFERSYGSFDVSQRVAIASASKLVSGVLLLRLVDQGYLSLDSTTGEVLGWTGGKSRITLRHLLSFTSGLQPEAPCTYRADVTLAACVETLASTVAAADPGVRFDYGSTHLHVAGRMAEVATGKSWNQLFAEGLAAPLGLPGDLVYVANPVQGEGAANPLPAGGLRMSMHEYEPLLRLVFDQGRWRNQPLMAPDWFEQQARAPYPDVLIGKTPGALNTMRYGLAAWLECDTPATGCSRLSSPGAFGFTPWIDRKSGYYAIIGMELHDRSGVDDYSNPGVALEQQLAPLIVQALGR